MPVIDAQVQIAAPIEKVYAIARDVESFPSYMPDVESIKIVEGGAQEPRVVTEWVGLVPEFKQKIRWTEEDNWDDNAHICRFRQVKGDYKEYEGEWIFTPAGDATAFRSTFTYDLEIPLIGPLIKNLVLKKMQINNQKILEAIKARAEET